MQKFWDSVGKTLAKIGKIACDGALWASQHPQVIETIASVAGKPAIAAAIGQYAPAAEAVGAAIESEIK